MRPGSKSLYLLKELYGLRFSIFLFERLQEVIFLQVLMFTPGVSKLIRIRNFMRPRVNRCHIVKIVVFVFFQKSNIKLWTYQQKKLLLHFSIFM